MEKNSYRVEQSYKTPLINFDGVTGNFEIKGKSIPDNSSKFYEPLLAWLDNYVQNPAPRTNLNLQLDYLNTNSTKSIMDMLKKLEQILKNGKGEIIINWLYEEGDDGILAVGEEYKSFIKIPFNLVSFPV